jgi:hypothetical protein
MTGGQATGPKAAGIAGVGLVLGLMAVPAFADQTTTLSFYGLPGLVEMPTARSLNDADLAITLAHFADQTRGTLAFQITPRLTGSFRYSHVPDYPAVGLDRYDRSLDLHFRFVDENGWRPALAIGLRDLGGTGLYASEYIVASKALGSKVDVSAGLGWGRLATHGGFDSPFGGGFDTRPPPDPLGGTPGYEQWFHGPAAVFGGISYRPTDRLALTVEYS